MPTAMAAFVSLTFPRIAKNTLPLAAFYIKGYNTARGDEM